MKKYGKESKIDQRYLLFIWSWLQYKKKIIEKLKISKYTDVVDMKHRMKLTEDEINYILY